MNAYLKAIAPALTALAMTLISAVQLGEMEWPALEVGLVGVVSALVSYFVTNGPAGLSRYAKALAPAFLTLVAVAVHAIVTGELGDPAEVRIAVAGLLTSLVTLVIPNVSVAVPTTPPGGTTFRP